MEKRTVLAMQISIAGAVFLCNEIYCLQVMGSMLIDSCGNQMIECG